MQRGPANRDVRVEGLFTSPFAVFLLYYTTLLVITLFFLSPSPGVGVPMQQCGVCVNKPQPVGNWSCYYAQHTHECYTGKPGCVLGPAIAANSATSNGKTGSIYKVICVHTPECPPLPYGGFFLRGFHKGCKHTQDGRGKSV